MNESVQCVYKPENTHLHKKGGTLTFRNIFFPSLQSHELLSNSFIVHLCERKEGKQRGRDCKTQCSTTWLEENKACIT